MDRFLQATAATLPLTWTVNGVATDPSPTATTVVVTREDGTALTSGSATRTGVGTFTFPLSAAQTTALDLLRIDWTSALGTVTTYAEIVAGFLFTVTQARAIAPLGNTTTYPTADVLTARTIAEQNLENACGVAFVPRYFRDKYDGTGGNDILLPPRLVSITSVSVGGVALSVGELAALELYADGRLYNPTGWACGRRNVEVKGAAGHKITPASAMQGSLALAKQWLQSTPLDERTSQLIGSDGTTQLLKEDGTFGLPAADRCILIHGVNAGLA